MGEAGEVGVEAEGVVEVEEVVPTIGVPTTTETAPTARMKLH